MKLFIDIKNRRFVKSAASNVALDRLHLKRRDQVPLEIILVEAGAAVATPAGTEFSVGLKSAFSDTNFLAFAAPGDTTLDLFTEPVEAAFLSGKASLPAYLEVKWAAPGEALRTATLKVDLQNAVITGDEGTPAVMPDGKATEEEATTGEDNTKWMTPLRTRQAINVLAGQVDLILENFDTEKLDSIAEAAQSIGTLNDDIAATAAAITQEAEARAAADTQLAQDLATKSPIGHTHTSEDITDFAEAVAEVSPPTTWENIPGKPETFPPSAHTHPTSEITGLSEYIVASAPGLSINSTICIADGTSVTYPIDGLVGNDPEHVLVALNGVTQAPVDDYSVSEASGTITFDAPPAAGTQIAATALGLRTVQPPIDPTLYLFAFDISLDGLTTYSGRLLNADRPAAPALPETASTWTINRTSLNAAGRVLATATATGSWANRETLAYQ